jgi:hypothetical protein
MSSWIILADAGRPQPELAASLKGMTVPYPYGPVRSPEGIAILEAAWARMATYKGSAL